MCLPVSKTVAWSTIYNDVKFSLQGVEVLMFCEMDIIICFGLFPGRILWENIDVGIITCFFVGWHFAINEQPFSLHLGNP